MKMPADYLEHDAVNVTYQWERQLNKCFQMMSRTPVIRSMPFETWTPSQLRKAQEDDPTIGTILQ